MAEPLYPDALPALTHLHWYVLERVLGQGGFGITYLAKDTNLDQRVAIKEYLPAEFASRLPDSTVRARTEELRDRYRWGLERFIQEARTLARFDHPNIVRVHSVFEFNNTAYIVMRFEEGGTLAALLDRRGTLSESDLMRILLPVLDGLELVHNAGFIHRDIKPDNIHLRRDGRPVLLDFGSARQAVGSSNTLTILVAPGYAPFEQYYSDPASQGPWTDIYGLAATAYRAICGRPPLDAVSRSKGILGSTQEIMVPASVVGAGRYAGRVLAAIDHGLAFAEKDRPQTIAEWRRELVGEAAEASAPPPMNAAASPRSLRPTAAEPTVLSPPPAATPRAPDSAAASSPAASAPAPGPIESAARPRSTPWAWTIAVAAVAAALVAGYFAIAGKNDNAAIKDWIAKQQAEADKRREEERARAEADRRKQEEKDRSEAEMKQAEQVARATEPVLGQQPAPRQRTLSARPNPPTPAPKQSKPPRAGSAPLAEKELKPTAAPAPTQNEIPSPSTTPVEATAPAPKTPVQRTAKDFLAEADQDWSEQRYADAIRIWGPLAEGANARAQARLGDAYAEGKGVERDAAKARAWYEKAANRSDTGAMLRLAAMFEGGKDPNNNLAYIWYCAAGQLGSSRGKDECARIASSQVLQPAERQQADRVVKNKVDEISKMTQEK